MNGIAYPLYKKAFPFIKNFRSCFLMFIIILSVIYESSPAFFFLLFGRNCILILNDSITKCSCHEYIK